MAAQASAFCEEDYRGALALNNMGVTLQEWGCCRQALDTFRDATVVMKRVCCTFVESDLPADGRTTSETQSAIAGAMRRLANPIVDGTKKKGASCEALDDDSNPFTVSDLVFQCSPTSSRVLFIRMEEYGKALSHDDYDRDNEADMAIVLQNYGLSCYCYARISEEESVVHILNQNAISVLSLAQTVLTTRSQNAMLKHFQIPKAYMIVIVITNNLSQVLYQNGGLHSSMTTCYARLFALIADLNAYDVRGAFHQINAASAA
jgi:hypothetical protein